MTLKRLMIILGVLVFLAGVGIMWLWQYAYTPEGRARVIIAQLKGDTTSLRGWMLQHHVVRPGFSIQPHEAYLDDVSPSVSQVAAADEMTKLGHEVLPIVIEALRDDKLDVQMMAVIACGNFRDPVAIQPLARCMRGGTGDPRNASTRPAILRGDGLIQHECVHSFAEIGPEAFDPLMELLSDSDWPVVHARAARALGKLKDKRATDALVGHLSDKYDDAASSAAQALGEIGDRKAIPALLKTIRSAPVNEKGLFENAGRISAAGSLARMGKDEGFQFLLTMIKSPNSTDRSEAAEAMGSPEISGAFATLLPLLGDSYWEVRYEAVKAITKFHDPRAIPSLRKLLTDPDDFPRRAAVQALGELHDLGAIPAVRKLLNDPGKWVRYSAAEALEKLGDKPPPASPIRAR